MILEAIEALLPIRAQDGDGRTPGRWWPFLGGRKTRSGTVINEQECLSISAVFRAVDLLASHLAMLPLPIFKVTGEDERNRDRNHRFNRLLNLQPNPDQTAFAMKRAIMAHCLLWGNGRIQIQRLAGQPAQLWPLLPSVTSTHRYKSGPKKGQLYHKTIRANGNTEEIDDTDCIHVSNLGIDGIVGYEIIKHLAADNMGLTKALETYAESYFGNGAIPGLVIQHPGKLKNPEKLAKEWKRAYGGPGGANSVAVLEEKATAEVLSHPNDASQFLESRTYQVKDVARWFNIPPHMLMEMSEATFSNISEQVLSYVKYSLAPWLEAWKQELNRKLLTVAEARRWVIDFITEAFLKGDPKGRAEYYKTMLEIGVFTINEIRRLENMNPIGPAGDQHFISTTFTTAERMLEDVVNPPEDEPTAPPGLPGPGGDDDEEEEDETQEVDARSGLSSSMKWMMANALERMSSVEANKARRKARQDPEAFDQWLQEFTDKHRTAVFEAVVTVFEALDIALLNDQDPSESRREHAAQEVVSTLRDWHLENWNAESVLTKTKPVDLANDARLIAERAVDSYLKAA